MERDTLSDATLHLLLSTPNPAPAARELEITRNAIRETLVLLDALREHEAELVAELAGVRD